MPHTECYEEVSLIVDDRRPTKGEEPVAKSAFLEIYSELTWTL